MAKQVVETILDDIDGSEGAETFSFAYEGIGYEIDLADKNAEAFREALAPYVKAARRASRGGSSKAKAASSVDLNAVRAWAAENGIEVAPRGRVAGAVIEKYEAANK